MIALLSKFTYNKNKCMFSFNEKMLKDLGIDVSSSWLLGSCMEYKGKQDLYEKQRPEVIKTLREVALIQSSESSNRIEGVTVQNKRLRPLILGQTRPKDRSEEEVVGYRNALNWIHNNYKEIEISPETILKLHKLAQEGFGGDAGKWKEKNNEIIEILPNGTHKLRFNALTAKKTPQAIKQLCADYTYFIEKNVLPPLLVVVTAVFDLLCIHPFRDGNGRVSRLLTLLLLYQNGYRVGRYVSIERLNEESKQTYYEALEKSSAKWHEGKHTLTPWWNYFLSTLLRAYKELEEKIEFTSSKRGAKTEAVEIAIKQLPKKFTLSDIEKSCPHVSRDMIRKVLKGMKKRKELICLSLGRNAVWGKAGNSPTK
jgi:Fic family protein